MTKNLWISAIGFVTPAGNDLGTFLQAIAKEPIDRDPFEFTLKSFSPAKFLSNRRMMKNVAQYHGYGMAAIEFLKQATNWNGDDHDPFRVGLFVGAPPASVMDHSNYIEPVLQAREIDSGHVEYEFGATCMGTLGTTLLTGLPNNVLCNGAIILNAKGKNDNYVMGETGAHYALASAARNLLLGHLDIGFAGGFSFHTDPVMTGMYRKTGHIEGSGLNGGRIRPYTEKAQTIFGDGAVFISLESESSAKLRGIGQPLAEFIDLAHCSFASGPFSDDLGDASLQVSKRIANRLQKQGIKKDDIGLIFLTGAGIPARDDLEVEIIDILFANEDEKPAVASVSPITGNLMEASGLLELACIEPAYADGMVPEGLKLDADVFASKGFGRAVSTKKPYVMIMRHAVWADQISCLVVKRAEVSHDSII